MQNAMHQATLSDNADLLPEYAELQCVTNFTFLRGASHAEELADRAVRLGYSALAITDECSLAGVVRAHVGARQSGLPLLIGSQFQLTQFAGNNDDAPACSIILLAQNREGYGNLCELITLARTRIEKGRYLLTPQDLADPVSPYSHLRGMPDCLAILLTQPGVTADELTRQAVWLKTVFPQRLWIALTLLRRPREEAYRFTVEQIAGHCGIPIVATGDVCMHVRSRKPLQDTLTAIRVGRPVSDCGYDLAPNAEQHLRSRLRLANLYPAAALQETVRIARLCTFSLDELRYEYPDELVPAGETPASYLRKQTYAGVQRRFPNGLPEAIRTTIEYELALIGDMKYEPYFLTVYDIVRFARSQRILCQGRGSAANSCVCYCLGITEVDPARSTLLFERFISRERNEPPDIDVDFEHQRREEVIQYIYGKYGRQRAALTAVVISYRRRSTLRDTGKALGVDPSVIDVMAKSHQEWNGKHSLAECFSRAGLDPDAPLARQWAGLADTLRDFPRHLSQHPGGFVIAQGKLSRIVPIENAAMPDRSIVQWDKDDLDALGILKVDVLALGMLTMIRRALDLVGNRRGRAFELQDIPAEDAATYDMICQADTIGVFQIESRAQMAMLPRMRPRNFYDLVIEVALVRPGPILGGMVHPYLRRRQNLELVSYPSPDVERALSRTLGVPIFQEQVMQIAIIAAGFTAGEADQLRRAMASWKRRGGLEKFQDKLVNGMRDRGYPDTFIEAICQQIHGFADYGFPESHSASFALLTYVSSWLKRHEPEAFLAALLNSQPMGFYAPAQLVQDARRHGVDVLPVDVRLSNWDATLEETDNQRPAVRQGLNTVRGLSQEAALRIESARAISGFTDITDMAARSDLSRIDLEHLARADALVSLVGNRRQAMWQAVTGVPQKHLLKTATITEDAVQLGMPGEAEDILNDYRATGLTLRRHPVALLRHILTKRRFLPADVLNTFSNGQFARGCGIVTARQRPGTAKGTLFITLEDETGSVNIIIWPTLVETYRKELLGSSLLGVYGIWQTESDVKNLIAKRLVDLSFLLGNLDTRSRDFM